MRCFASGGKWRLTYSLPSRSPVEFSISASARFQRGLICGVPDSVRW